MISFSLSEPDALEAISALQLRAGASEIAAGVYARDGLSEQALEHSQRSQKLSALAMHLQTELVKQRQGTVFDRPMKYRHVKFAPGD